MTNKQIKENYKQKIKENKKEYINNKHYIKDEYEKEICNYYEKDEVNKKNNPPYRSVLNEIGNSVSHGVGSAFAIIVLILMLTKSKTTNETIGAIIYSLGMFILFTMSTLYHAFPYGSKVKRLFRRFDYSSIYILIGATYTPIVLCYIGGTYGLIFCIIQWLIIAIGITFIGIFGPGRFKKLHYTLYIILGWCGVIFLPQMVTKDLSFFIYILIGGIIYSLGIIPFAINKKVSHFIWHFFVLGGAIIQWVGIYLYIYCK